MAITRRQFVTRLGALAAVVGFSQAEVSKIAEAFAGNTTAFGGTADKPRVIWIHGAECTGCSTSLLGILESPGGYPLVGNTSLTTGAALAAATVEATSTTLGVGGVTGETDNAFTLWAGSAPPLGLTPNVSVVEDAALVNIADVVIDVIDLQYHETVMSMGGDLASQWLKDFETSASNTLPFVLVVEGALQNKVDTGAWTDTAGNDVPWCSIGCSDDFEGATGFEIDMPDMVEALAVKTNCAAIIPIGQCATFGGYPGCKPPLTAAAAGSFNPAKSQTGAMGVSAYLTRPGSTSSAAAGKVINVPGCPTNPWWFVLTVVLFMADYVQDGALGILLPGSHAPNPAAVDTSGRLKAVYPIPVHSGWCPRYPYYKQGKYALTPGATGCLQRLGCKGIATKSQCGVHGWNNQQPQNPGSLATLNPGVGGLNYGGHCTKAGHPCMACTEKGYPDSFVPFVKL